MHRRIHLQARARLVDAPHDPGATGPRRHPRRAPDHATPAILCGTAVFTGPAASRGTTPCDQPSCRVPCFQPPPSPGPACRRPAHTTGASTSPASPIGADPPPCSSACSPPSACAAAPSERCSSRRRSASSPICATRSACQSSTVGSRRGLHLTTVATCGFRCCLTPLADGSVSRTASFPTTSATWQPSDPGDLAQCDCGAIKTEKMSFKIESRW